MKKELKKIVTIGPTYPFRGGIAQYGSLLIQELEKRYEISCVSFSLMYPKILYPGKTQKDYTMNNVICSEIKYLINTVNPFSYIKTARYINKYNPDMVIIHWWHPYFSFVDLTITKLLKKDVKVCICCNNVMPHDKIPFAGWLTKKVLRSGDMYIVHSDDEEKQLYQIVGENAHHIKIPCPDISTFTKTGMEKPAAREALGFDSEEKVLLFFGFVRKYKGLYHLINIMPQLVKAMPDIKLMIVGDFYDDKDKYLTLIKDKQIEEHVVIFDQFIPDTEVERYFVASDVVVLPYDSATTSGVIQAAYNFNRPVIVTDVGGLSEAVVEGKTGYVVEPENEDALCQKIEEFYAEHQDVNYVEFIDKERYKYSWERVVDLIQEMWTSYEE